jgi:hypothetical protein
MANPSFQAMTCPFQSFIGLTNDQFDEVEIRELCCIGALPMRPAWRSHRSGLNTGPEPHGPYLGEEHFGGGSFHLLSRISNGGGALWRRNTAQYIDRIFSRTGDVQQQEASHNA